MKILLSLLISCLMSSTLYAENLVIGTSSFNPPMETQVTKNDVFTGFEIDLMNEICRRINANCVYEPMSFAGIMEAVAAGKVDLGIDGFFITKERLAYYLFSSPYLRAKAQMFSAADSDINSDNVNTGKRIGVEAGTVYKSLLQQMYDNVKVVEYNNQPDMLQDLSDHKLDLIMFDFIGASYWVNDNPKEFKLVGKPISFDMGYGVMANLNRQELITRVNNALNSMENDGTYLAIYSRYFEGFQH
ncbi:Putative ABC transporter arginine-binding protein 2 precursor [Legionella massiliensis]|uniref:Putative ABC transporter arginine-binding protein 2 n=1 Tax=Legionella massiliensis TaxID=1034943 RepID=A0A078KVN8_9GAMM|nr:transporter substrate-binding domain-containing protein [Legionella massiliensis]CDZ78485.1 Putative ABC transporter arginine-binding protein 2 precursor [Legionella massiliensis]CEE14223.1 Putative ABC transporter arginine-binding protein 2 precursor [Legionella massiliensis]